MAGYNLAYYGTNFATDCTAPTVTRSNPVNKAVNVATDKVITIIFNEAIKAGTNWIDLKSSNGTVLNTTPSINGNVLTITPDNSLNNATRYSLILHTGSVTDMAGNNIAYYGTNFVTYTAYIPVYITSDNIINSLKDTDRVNQIINGLATLGVYAVNWGLGPNMHITVLQSSQVPQNAVVVDIYGGACAGTIYEMGTAWYKTIKGTRDVFTVFWPTATDITGLAWLPRAHDDDFDPPSFKGLAHPDQYMLNNGYRYIYSGNINTIINSIYEEIVT